MEYLGHVPLARRSWSQERVVFEVWTQGALRQFGVTGRCQWRQVRNFSTVAAAPLACWFSYFRERVHPQGAATVPRRLPPSNQKKNNGLSV